MLRAEGPKIAGGALLLCRFLNGRFLAKAGRQRSALLQTEAHQSRPLLARAPAFVMPGLDPGIPSHWTQKDHRVDPRIRSGDGDDDLVAMTLLISSQGRGRQNDSL
jgi:hypothetical protein